MGIEIQFFVFVCVCVFLGPNHVTLWDLNSLTGGRT